MRNTLPLLSHGRGVSRVQTDQASTIEDRLRQEGELNGSGWREYLCPQCSKLSAVSLQNRSLVKQKGHLLGLAAQQGKLVRLMAPMVWKFS